jgi:outer membrane protein assembly factor BamB
MMRWILLTLLVGLTVFAWSQDAPDVRPMLRDVFPVSQLKPGMRGYGLTVFKDTKIERFEVEVVGVLENALYGYPLVMIRMRGGPITERGAMVIAGMSGSPIFIEGKILGALAYGFGFPKEPVALVTPLEAMLTNLHPRAESQLAELRSGHMIRKPVRIAGVRYAGVYIGHEQPTTPNVAWARPLMTPIMVSGVSPRTMKYLEAMLKHHGFTPLMAPSGGTAKQVPVRFEPGAAVATPLATGDIDLSAIGTLTYRKGDYVLAFGHPFFGLGTVEMPMHAAEIVDVFSSYAASFKLGNRAQPLGAIYYDGAFAIAGRMGQRARMIPMTARITNPARALQREFRCEVFNHPMFTGQIALTAALEFLDRVHFDMGEASATVRWRLQTRPFGEIRYENRVATRDSLAFAALGDLNYALNLLMNAPERKVELERIELEIEVQPGKGAAVIDSLQVDRFTYRPGERIEATVQVRTRDGNVETYRTNLRLPADMMPGRYMLQVSAGGGGAPAGATGLLALLLGEGAFGGGRGDTEAQLREFLSRERNYQMTVALNLPFPTISVAGAPLLQPPPLMRSVFVSQRVSKAQQTPDRIKQVVDTPHVLEGAQSVMITVLPADTGRSPFGRFAPPPFVDADETPAETDEAESLPSAEASAIVANLPPPPPLGEPSFPDLASEGGARPDTRAVSRTARQWQPARFDQLRRGTFEGAALDMDGAIRLSVAPRALPSAPLNFVWSVAPDGEAGLLLGGGVGGRIVRVGAEPSEQTYPSLPGAFVTALARSENGDLYAGLSPEGTLCRVGQRGYEVVAPLNARYVNAMRWYDGVLYLATGLPAQVLAWDGNTLRCLLTIDETHFSALTVGADGAVYAGTSERGMVYRIDPAGAISPIATLSEPSIVALATDATGNLYIATAPSGQLYRWTPKSGLTPLHSQLRREWRALVMHHDSLYALTPEEVYWIPTDSETLSPALIFRQRGLQLIGGGVVSERLHLASADGRLYVLEPTAEGVYLSPVLDAGAPARWGALRWSASLPDGAQLTLQTRSGNTPEPDASWSLWTTAYENPEGSTILSPPAQYLQVRVHLKGAGDAVPTLHRFSVSYMPQNRPPEVQLIGLTPYKAVSGKHTLRWRGRDPDGDTLRYEVQIARDGTNEWQPLKNGQPKPNGNPTADMPTAPNAPPSIDALGLDDLPEEFREQIRQQMARVGQTRMPDADAPEPKVDDAPSRAERPDAKTRFEWDTTQVPDGVYLLRVMATDEPASPTDCATVYSPAIPIVVCNTPPVVSVRERDVKVAEDGVVELTGFAFQYFVERKEGSADSGEQASERARRILRQSAPIVGVQYQIGDGEWFSAEPLDGMFDSAFEPFRIRTKPLPPGEHTMRIKVFNGAGKSTVVEPKVSVPAKPTATE